MLIVLNVQDTDAQIVEEIKQVLELSDDEEIDKINWEELCTKAKRHSLFNHYEATVRALGVDDWVFGDEDGDAYEDFLGLVQHIEPGYGSCAKKDAEIPETVPIADSGEAEIIQAEVQPKTTETETETETKDETKKVETVEKPFEPELAKQDQEQTHGHTDGQPVQEEIKIAAIPAVSPGSATQTCADAAEVVQLSGSSGVDKAEKPADGGTDDELAKTEADLANLQFKMQKGLQPERGDDQQRKGTELRNRSDEIVASVQGAVPNQANVEDAKDRDAGASAPLASLEKGSEPITSADDPDPAYEDANSPYQARKGAGRGRGRGPTSQTSVSAPKRKTVKQSESTQAIKAPKQKATAAPPARRPKKPAQPKTK